MPWLPGPSGCAKASGSGCMLGPEEKGRVQHACSMVQAPGSDLSSSPHASRFGLDAFSLPSALYRLTRPLSAAIVPQARLGAKAAAHARHHQAVPQLSPPTPALRPLMARLPQVRRRGTAMSGLRPCLCLDADARRPRLAQGPGPASASRLPGPDHLAYPEA
ncbi:hypothetical protein CDD82_3104 [Ophiocordyceps australis]|uniref:Uncharacterized protein n=1 Tax=Ophiocordyceps australis TaxID=1399860 RepID=A0A2C5XTW4_9HYPO|nr:hypothetical protein CDD82_3104 [Ophiocordyceps australis]